MIYCNFERCRSGEIRYILKHYMYLNCCLSVFLLSLIQLSDPICVIAFGIKKALWVLFSWYIFLLLKTLWHVLYQNLGKIKVWVSLLLNLIVYWWFLVNLLIPNEYKFAFLVTLPSLPSGRYFIIPFDIPYQF